MKYIRFEKDEEIFNGHPTYSVINKRSGDPIGQIFWYKPWNCWTGRFYEGSVWSEDCLQCVREFMMMEEKP